MRCRNQFCRHRFYLKRFFPSRSLLIWFGLLFLGGFPLHASAHDLGVSKALLKEQAGNRYTLRVQTSNALAAQFQTPRLPEHCAYLGEVSAKRSAAGVSWDIQCSGRPLTGEDELFLPWQREGLMLTAQWRDGSKSTRFFAREAGGMTVSLAQLQAGSGSMMAAAKRYLLLGAEHIALGIDHLLFVLCLLMVVRGIWPLVKTITAFTLAHSITLGLATLGVVNFSPVPVEATIALSIVFLAAEILRHHRGDTQLTLTYRAPWLIAFGFGLLHGFGFAGALAELGLPQGEIPIALLFFNLGVEAGQLLFVTVIMLLGFALHKLSRSRQDILLRVTAYGIGGLATFWFIQRSAQIILI